MKAGGQNPATFLAWVREDLDRVIHQLQSQIEHLAGISGVQGEAVLGMAAKAEDLLLTFRTLMLTGPTMLGEEMYETCRLLVVDQARDRESAFSTILEAALLLPAYLDRLQAGHRDLPLLLMPTINKLRAARQLPEQQEAALFTPPLDIELPELDAIEVTAADGDGLVDLAQRLRHQFETAMLAWFNAQDEGDSLSPLQGICETLLHQLQRLDLRRTWWIAGEIIAGVAEGKIDNDAHLRRLLARLHLNLKALSEGGEDAVRAEATDALSRSLLFRAATARPGHSGIIMLRRRFQLKEMFPDQEALVQARSTLSGKDRQLYQSIGAAVEDELRLIKDTLDLERRNGAVEKDRRALCREAMSRLEGTLSLLAMADASAVTARLLEELDRCDTAEGEALGEALVAIAGGLLQVESAVQEQIETLGEPLPVGDRPHLIELPASEYRRIEYQLLNEVVRSVHQFEDVIKERLGGDSAVDTRSAITEVAGAVELLGHREAADLCARMVDTSDQFLRSSFSEAALDPHHLEWFTDAVSALELYMAALRDRQNTGSELAAVIRDRLDRLDAANESGDADMAPDMQAEAVPGHEAESGQEATKPVQLTTSSISSEAVVIDPELLEVFLEEYEEVTENLQLHLPAWLSGLSDVETLTEVRRGFHTLKGSGRMVGAFELGDFCWRIEDMLNALLAGRIGALADAAVIVRLAQAALPALKQRLMNQSSGLTHEVIEAIGRHAEALAQGGEVDWGSLRSSLPGFLAGMLPEHLRDQVPSATENHGGEDEEVREALCEELHENLRTVETLLDSVSLNRNTLATEAHVRAAHSIGGALALAPSGRDVEVARALEEALEVQRHHNSPFNNEALWALGSCFAFLQARLEQLEGDPTAEGPEDEESLLNQLADLKTWFEQAEPMEQPPLPEGKEAVEALAEPASETEPAAAPEPVAEEPAPAAKAVPLDEITQIFLEEAHEVLARCDSLLNTWRDNLHAMPLVQNLQREIHTFKGGARMAGLGTLGHLSHAMEELLERTARHEIPPTERTVQVLERGCDQLNSWVEQVGRGDVPQAGKVLEDFLKDIENVAEGVEQAPEPELPPPPSEPKVVTDLPEVEPQPSSKAEDTPGQKHIRVDATLLDNMIKSAGEVNIFRARLERQIEGLRGNLGEFNETIGRLREQFRKLDMETEAQIRSRYRDTTTSGGEEFDPLELDRFSSMQQLSRGLSESVADLLNLEELLEDAARQADTLLTQQSRVSTDLQEGLMRTRMVPFGSVGPRLRRLVRTATAETGKKARLKLLMAGNSDQLDRNVLDHITVPLEHMLRNAIAHGIEAPGARKAAGKDPEGEIRILVESEATEFVIRVEDDGGGIDRQAIRERAIEVGLIDKAANPPPQQLFELILGSGFTTSTTVTGLAGRGVGMDVVNSEIKQIGGSLEIHSEEGRGSRFTIRIPFTLAVMQAIGVSAGDQRYFIPLAGVAGVARVQPADYQALLEADRPAYQFAGEQFQILDLEPLLGEPARPLGNDNVSLLMVRSGEQRAAFRVPELLGHREVVIKPVGVQITSVPGILGGTVTGDGRVVVVLDPGPIIRQAVQHGVRPVLPERHLRQEPKRKVAMVVDDSITMRKVNSRVLESQGIRAVTAKDGQDAVEQLQDRIPDIMLLDIEMPRMDGYQLAEYVRGDARLRHIPIVMITSRSGQKHRDRATQAGANDYLTKPYKEADLVEVVQRLLGAKEA